jgi:hypothetical protein
VVNQANPVLTIVAIVGALGLMVGVTNSFEGGEGANVDGRNYATGKR